MQAEVNAREVSVETLNELPIWKLESFCKEFRVAVVLSGGKITEIVEDN